MNVKKAIILAAGFGTRVLPASKSVPKEMVNIVDKPAIQYIVEEMSAAGIKNILIITSRGKDSIADHFDRSPGLETVLIDKGNQALYERIKSISYLADISYSRQLEMKGTGNAVLSARQFVGDDPFVVAYADDIIIGDDPATEQCVRAFEETGKAAVAMKEVSLELVMKYSSLKVKNLRDNIYKISDMNEKPKENEILSHFSILGRCVLPAKIFGILEKTAPGAGGEVQLTDAMKVLARTEGMTGVDFTGVRYDTGSKIGILKASVEVGLNHKEVGEEFKEYLKETVSRL
ncbi:MAG: UTP--glucose-1-phosphate uridylyltransferase [Eubacterium sp.]|jgi:UTP--glucose-1-phosphate uridylyltransferase|nr:UTP--glucose-1-phosphate uridylyltransferase [Eubacterium sp.]